MLPHYRDALAVQKAGLLAAPPAPQAACTPKELRELVTLEDVAVHAPPDQMAVSPADEAEMKAVRMRRRMYDLIKGAAAKQPADARRHLYFQFYRNPVEVLVDAGAACGVRVERTRLEATPRGMIAVGTGEFETHPAQLVLKSIGYRSVPLEGVAFDTRAGVIPNTAGRVLKGGAGGPSVRCIGCAWQPRLRQDRAGSVDLRHGQRHVLYASLSFPQRSFAAPANIAAQSVAAATWTRAFTCAGGSSEAPRASSAPTRWTLTRRWTACTGTPQCSPCARWAAAAPCASCSGSEACVR